jgi:hypothetical protein
MDHTYYKLSGLRKISRDYKTDLLRKGGLPIENYKLKSGKQRTRPIPITKISHKDLFQILKKHLGIEALKPAKYKKRPDPNKKRKTRAPIKSKKKIKSSVNGINPLTIFKKNLVMKQLKIKTKKKKRNPTKKEIDDEMKKEIKIKNLKDLTKEQKTYLRRKISRRLWSRFNREPKKKETKSKRKLKQKKIENFNNNKYFI